MEQRQRQNPWPIRGQSLEESPYKQNRSEGAGTVCQAFTHSRTASLRSPCACPIGAALRLEATVATFSFRNGTKARRTGAGAATRPTLTGSPRERHTSRGTGSSSSVGSQVCGSKGWGAPRHAGLWACASFPFLGLIPALSFSSLIVFYFP